MVHVSCLRLERWAGFWLTQNKQRKRLVVKLGQWCPNRLGRQELIFHSTKNPTQDARENFLPWIPGQSGVSFLSCFSSRKRRRKKYSFDKLVCQPDRSPLLKTWLLFLENLGNYDPKLKARLFQWLITQHGQERLWGFPGGFFWFNENIFWTSAKYPNPLDLYPISSSYFGQSWLE